MSHYIITGATGWIGRIILFHILKIQGHLNNVICVASSSRNENLGFATVKTITFKDMPIVQNASVFHCAYLTKDKNSLMTNEEYITKNHQIRDEVAKLLNMEQKNFFYASSGAVYHMNGYSLYGELKLQDEEFFKNLCLQKNIKFLNVRIFNLIGPYIQNYELYAISDFILQCMKRNEIIISSKNHVIRSYINVMDLVHIIFKFFEDQTSKMYYDFDTVHKTLTLLELAIIIKNTIGNEKTEIIHNIDENLLPNYYVGNQENQNKIIERYQIKLQSIENSIIEMKNYLLKI